MEQQTISIAKAGITTILNSRSAVLAAANPVFGRYDDMMSAAENIDFLPTILSRFDLIFIVRDIRNQQRDMEIARHVIAVHMNAGGDAGRASADGSTLVAHTRAPHVAARAPVAVCPVCMVCTTWLGKVVVWSERLMANGGFGGMRARHPPPPPLLCDGFCLPALLTISCFAVVSCVACVLFS
jgi:hypothetical protein